jgi:hypothetical protein
MDKRSSLFCPFVSDDSFLKIRCPPGGVAVPAEEREVLAGGFESASPNKSSSYGDTWQKNREY